MPVDALCTAAVCPLPGDKGHAFPELEIGLKSGASDWHFRAGESGHLRVAGELAPIEGPPLPEAQLQQRAMAVLDSPLPVAAGTDATFCHGGDYFRFHSYTAGGAFAFTLRHIPAALRSLKSLGVPPAFATTALASQRGLILVTGPAGSGKSTTVAAALDRLNRQRAELILTLEDPIEHRHTNLRGVVRQLEKGRDFSSFSEAVRGALRSDPDVLLVGEMRDLETIAAALTAAETGHLVLGTLHTACARDAVSRIVDVFPARRAGEVRSQLAKSLVAVLAQQLVRSVDRRPVAAFELLLSSPGVRNLITESGGRDALIPNEIATGSARGMISMDQSLESLWRKRIIDRGEALRVAFCPTELESRLTGISGGPS